MEVNFSIENNERDGLVIKDRVGHVLFTTPIIEEIETTRYKLLIKDRLGQLLKAESVSAPGLQELKEEDLQLLAIIAEGKAEANTGFNPDRANKDLISGTMPIDVENSSFAAACFDLEGVPISFILRSGKSLHPFA